MIDSIGMIKDEYGLSICGDYKYTVNTLICKKCGSKNMIITHIARVPHKVNSDIFDGRSWHAESEVTRGQEYMTMQCEDCNSNINIVVPGLYSKLAHVERVVLDS